MVGWHLGQQIPTELLFISLEQALALRQLVLGLLIHADCGSQYISAACRACIEKAQSLASYSRQDNPQNNAQTEALEYV